MPSPRGEPVLIGSGPGPSPVGGCSTVRTNAPSGEYSLITPVKTLDTYQLPVSGAATIAFGLTSWFSPAGMNSSLVTVSASGAPVPSVLPQPPAASGDVGNGPVYFQMPDVGGRADAT